MRGINETGLVITEARWWTKVYHSILRLKTLLIKSKTTTKKQTWNYKPIVPKYWLVFKNLLKGFFSVLIWSLHRMTLHHPLPWKLYSFLFPKLSDSFPLNLFRCFFFLCLPPKFGDPWSSGLLKLYRQLEGVHYN